MHLRFVSLSSSQTDVVEVYLDSGHVRIPDTVVVPKLPFEVADQVSHALATILNAKVHVQSYKDCIGGSKFFAIDSQTGEIFIHDHLS